VSAPVVSRRRLWLTLVAALATVAGCGRKGPPQPPADDKADDDGGDS
jgi:predicted small lipoprotein YifL